MISPLRCLLFAWSLSDTESISFPALSHACLSIRILTSLFILSKPTLSSPARPLCGQVTTLKGTGCNKTIWVAMCHLMLLLEVFRDGAAWSHNPIPPKKTQVEIPIYPTGRNPKAHVFLPEAGYYRPRPRAQERTATHHFSPEGRLPGTWAHVFLK